MPAHNLDPRRYAKLLSKVLPRPIELDKECHRVSAVIKSMMNREHTPEERALFNLLVGLVTEYEDRTVAMPDLPPDQLLRSLLESGGMKQTELAKLWGISKSYTSGIVNGKRPISKAQAKLAAERFKVAVDLIL